MRCVQNMDSSPSSSQPVLQFLEPGYADDTKPRCTICGKTFKRLYALERHIVVHDPQRARLEHKCPHEGCKFSSLQKSNVKTHVAAVHEKIKHRCTLPRTAEDALASGTSQSERCGRIFSDAPALIRHEKRAHGHFRRGPNAKPRPNLQKVSTQFVDVAGSTVREVASASAEDLHAQTTTVSSPPDEKVQYWLQGSDMRTTAEMEWESESVTPSATSFTKDESYNSGLTYASASVSINTSVSASMPASASVSDAESLSTGSVSSSISTSPSPAPPEPSAANQYYPPVSTYPPTYPQGYYYSYASTEAQAYDASRAYSLHPAHYAQAQTQGTIYYDNESANPPIEEWLPQLAEMKHTMQANGIPNGTSEWDGTVTTYRAFFD